jgi:pimeloyl-ACP methyl ester carboxylesterase
MTGIYKTANCQRAVEERYRQILQYWPVPNRQFPVPTRQGETSVIECGNESGPPVLMLHGSLANSAAWMGDVARWTEHNHIYAVDVIGEPGLSAQSRPPLASDAYALWLEDVLHALSLEHAALVGVSLGGWLALDYATRNPERVDRMVLVCPGGVGKQKIGILFKILFYSLFGAWGRRALRTAILGRMPTDGSPAAQKFGEFFALLQESTRPRKEKLPLFDDAALRRLTMPLLAIVGGKDAPLDSADTRRRVEALVPNSEVRYLEEAGHFIPGQGDVMAEFLQRGVVAGREREVDSAVQAGA